MFSGSLSSFICAIFDSETLAKREFTPAIVIYYCLVPENIHTPPRKGFALWAPHPSGNSNLASYIPLNFWVFETPPPPWNFQSLLWGEYGYFLEPHILNFNYLFIEGKTRKVKLDENFYTGYRRTILQPSEVLVDISIPFTEKVLEINLCQAYNMT